MAAAAASDCRTLGLEHAELDHLVVGTVGAGGLATENKPDEVRYVRGDGTVDQRRNSAQHTILSSALQYCRDAVEIFAQASLALV